MKTKQTNGGKHLVSVAGVLRALTGGRWRVGRRRFGTALLICCAAPTLFGQSVVIDWFTLEGGGTSTSGGYALSGSIGQPDAGRMSGGNYGLQGGFWSVGAALQGPPLWIELSNRTVTVRWAGPATDWVLDRTATLSGSPIPWLQVPVGLYETNLSQVFIRVRAGAGNEFYRLRKL